MYVYYHSRSGTEEEYGERAALLQDITDRMAEVDVQKKNSKKEKSSKGDQVAAAIRDEAMRTFTVKPKGWIYLTTLVLYYYMQYTSNLYVSESPLDIDPSESPSAKKPKLSRDDRLLSIMEEEVKLKRRQQEIEEKRLQFEEEKWKIEKDEKMAMLDLLKNVMNK